jgi:hypothetical protein
MFFATISLRESQHLFGLDDIQPPPNIPCRQYLAGYSNLHIVAAKYLSSNIVYTASAAVTHSLACVRLSLQDEQDGTKEAHSSA